MGGQTDIAAALSSSPDGVTVRVKVVPGSSRDRIAGVLGDRLKVTVSAPPEAGKANRAVCELLASLLGVTLKQVTLIQGQTQPLKTIRVTGMTLCDVTQHIGKQTDKT